MASLLSRLFNRAAPALPEPSPLMPVAASLADLLDLVQKSSRSQARLALRLEEIERKMEAGFDDLRQRVVTEPSRQAPEFEWADVLDALDALSDARSHAQRVDQPDLAHGLGFIANRLECFLVQGAVQRIADPGPTLDGKLFRVVGTQHRPELAAGAVVRVLRAAALASGRILREGEVIVSRGEP